MPRPVAVAAQRRDVEIRSGGGGFAWPRFHEHATLEIHDLGKAVAGGLEIRHVLDPGSVRRHDIREVFDRARPRGDVLRREPGHQRLGARVTQRFGAAQRETADQLRVLDFLGCDHRQVADRRTRHRKDRFLAVEIEVTIPVVVRRRREHRREPPVIEDAGAVGVEDVAGLEIDARKVRIRLVGIAAEVNAVLARQAGQARVLRPIRLQGGAARPLADRGVDRKSGENVFRQHDEPYIVTGNDLQAGQCALEPQEVRGDDLPRRRGAGREIDRVALELERDGSVLQHVGMPRDRYTRPALGHHRCPRAWQAPKYSCRSTENSCGRGRVRRRAPQSPRSPRRSLLAAARISSINDCAAGESVALRMKRMNARRLRSSPRTL